MREIILDTETTGLSPDSGHRVIEIGCVELIDRRKTGNVFQVYINPERDVPDEAFRIHGISSEFLLDKPKFKECVQQFIDFIADHKIIAHNASFDMKFLNHELNLLKLPIINNIRVIDTLHLARKKYPGAKNSLNALCNRFNIDLTSRNFHGALLDAELLAEVYLKMHSNAQASMIFKSKPKKKEELPYIRSYRSPRIFPVVEEEIKTHLEFIKRLKNPLWLQ